jgi:hypothetical protein
MAAPKQNAPLVQSVGPAGGGVPFWGLNKYGTSENEGPLFADDPWSSFWLGTRQLPGECSISQSQVARLEVNKKKGKGIDGARITVSGYDPREFSVVCQIATPAQLAELEDIYDVYWVVPGKVRNLTQIAVSVYHPGLAMLKIYAAVLVGISIPVDGKIEGAKNVTFTFQESTLPTVKNVTKSNSAPAPGEDPRKPSSESLQNSSPDPPESINDNMSTDGPLYTPASGVS